MTHDINASLKLHKHLTENHAAYTKARRSALAHFPLYLIAYEFAKKRSGRWGSEEGYVHFVGHGIYISLWLRLDETPTAAALLISQLLEAQPGLAVTQTKTTDGQRIELQQDAPIPLSIVINVYIHADALNCERVQVGVEPVYEWKCKEENADENEGG
jgi:hypothetical protein